MPKSNAKHDMFGRELRRGDLIVYPANPKSGPVKMQWGIVAEFTKKGIRVRKDESITI